MGLNEDFEVGDVVNDTAGNAGNIYEVVDDYLIKVQWEDESVTLEEKKQIIWVSH